MGQKQPYISLDSIIKDWMVENDFKIHTYFKAWHLAFRGFEQLGLDFFYKIQSVKLPVNANFTVTLPADYIQWTKCGILNDSGEIIPLYYNDKFTTYADLLPTRVEQTQDPESLILQGGWGLNTWGNYWNGSGYVNIYGVPSGEPFVGSFKIDTQNGVILLNEHFNRNYIMLEYVCSPVEGQEYYVPVQFKEAIIAFLNWKMAKIGASRYAWRIEGNLRHEFYNERRIAIARWHPVRLEEMYQSSQQMTRLAIKS